MLYAQTGAAEERRERLSPDSDPRRTRPDLQRVYEGAEAWSAAIERHKGGGALLRGAWLYGVTFAPTTLTSHAFIAHEAERFVNAKSGVFFTGHDRLFERIFELFAAKQQARGAAPRAKPQARKDLQRRLYDMRSWGWLEFSDALKERPADLCKFGGIGPVFVLTAPKGDWDALVNRYRIRDGQP
jgi:hypothetical protein